MTNHDNDREETSGDEKIGVSGEKLPPEDNKNKLVSEETPSPYKPNLQVIMSSDEDIDDDVADNDDKVVIDLTDNKELHPGILAQFQAQEEEETEL